MTGGRRGLLAAVAIGGALGTAGRLLVAAALGVGWGTLSVNIVGCALLGILVVRVRTPGGRALFGTGLAGALTTFSGFAVESLALLASAPLSGIAYLIGSPVLGVVAARAGLRLGARTLRPAGGRPAGRRGDPGQDPRDPRDPRVPR